MIARAVLPIHSPLRVPRPARLVPATQVTRDPTAARVLRVLPVHIKSVLAMLLAQNAWLEPIPQIKLPRPIRARRARQIPHRSKQVPRKLIVTAMLDSQDQMVELVSSV